MYVYIPDLGIHCVHARYMYVYNTYTYVHMQRWMDGCDTYGVLERKPYIWLYVITVECEKSKGLTI